LSTFLKPPSAKLSRLRIIGGEWRSRLIEFPDIDSLRPTPDRVRETLFNWLGQTLYGKTCLDLFAGSGALGFEALSRRAESVVMLESARDALSALKQNAVKLAAQNLQVIQGDALQYVRGKQPRFDVIFLDPPYKLNLLPELLPLLPPLLKPNAVVYLEHDSKLELGAEWQLLKSGRAGQVYFGLITLITEGALS
jgi:16S rRNA (guanine966-N2)-methyltransferase